MGEKGEGSRGEGGGKWGRRGREVGGKGEGSRGEGGGKWGRRGREVGGKGEGTGNGVPPCPPPLSWSVHSFCFSKCSATYLCTFSKKGFTKSIYLHNRSKPHDHQKYQ